MFPTTNFRGVVNTEKSQRNRGQFWAFSRLRFLVLFRLSLVLVLFGCVLVCCYRFLYPWSVQMFLFPLSNVVAPVLEHSLGYW